MSNSQDDNHLAEPDASRQGAASSDAGSSDDGAVVEAESIRDKQAVPPIRRRVVRGMHVGSSFHWTILIVSGCVLTVSMILDVREGSVTTGLASIPLPGLCTFKRMTGMDCPGCGLTRCFVSLSHGQFASAWNYNPAGYVIYIATVFQIPYRIFQIRRIRRGLVEWNLGWFGTSFLLLAALLLMVQWAVRVAMMI